MLIFILLSFPSVKYFQPGSAPSRPYEAPTPGAGWASTPGGNYSEAGTPRDSSAYGNTTSYLPPEII
jgi:transcription elongation factor SPT5